MEGLHDRFHLYFEYKEFDSPDLEGTYKLMDVDFLNMLAEAREIANTPFKITSGYRTESHNEKVGGVTGSSHTLGYAADIYTPTSTQKFKVMEALIEVGFTRIGVSKNFIHVDNDPSKSQMVLWTY